MPNSSLRQDLAAVLSAWSRANLNALNRAVSSCIARGGAFRSFSPPPDGTRAVGGSLDFISGDQSNRVALGGIHRDLRCLFPRYPRAGRSGLRLSVLPRLYGARAGPRLPEILPQCLPSEWQQRGRYSECCEADGLRKLPQDQSDRSNSGKVISS
jgi:hypothetical protein